MKNIKLIMLLIAFCLLVTTQNSYAQDDSRAAQEKAELNNARNNDKIDLSNKFEQDLSELVIKREKASGKKRARIQEEINTLKASYNKEVKGIENIDLAEADRRKLIKEKAEMEDAFSDKKYDMSDKDEFIIDARKRIKVAKVKFAKAQENGTLTPEQITLRRDKIGLAEKRLSQYEASVGDAKIKIAERMQEIKQLQ